MATIPDPETVLRDMSLPLPTIYAALQYGIFKTREFFDTQEHEDDRVINRYLAPNLVRYFAKQALERKGQSVTDEFGDDLNLENVPNNGICISYGGYSIRILKSNNGDLPVPGHSKSRQDFYNQQLSMPYPPIEVEEESPQKLNLLLLWDVIPSYDLGLISLACPKSGGLTRESVSAHWYCRVPDSLLLGRTEEPINVEPLEVEDLPISLNIPAKTGTEDIQ